MRSCWRHGNPAWRYLSFLVTRLPPAPALCPQDEQQLAALRSMGVAGAVTHLLQTTSGLGRLLRAAPVLVGLLTAGQGS